MNNIQLQIKSLQRKQAHIDMLRSINELIATVTENPDHDGLKKEVQTQITEHINGLIKCLEDGRSPQEMPESAAANSTFEVASTIKSGAGSFSEQEITALKMIIARVSEKVPAQNPSPQRIIDRGPGVPGVQVGPVERQQKLQFAKENKHLENKIVKIITKDGPIDGKVVGLDAPNIVVELSTGYRIPVSLSQLIE